MKKFRSLILLSLFLVFISAALYFLQMQLFKTPRDTLFYFIQDLAFLPLEVAIVTVVIGRVINSLNKQDRLKKVNMAISAFFSEAGTDIMMKLESMNEDHDSFRKALKIEMAWTSADFSAAIKTLKNMNFNVVYRAAHFEMLKLMLHDKREFMLRMHENPNLLEHETFTDMLLAVFHLTEELLARDDFSILPPADTMHLVYDAKRALQTLLIQWLCHMEHLNSDYPYLYSLEVRRNPFGDAKSVVIME